MVSFLERNLLAEKKLAFRQCGFPLNYFNQLGQLKEGLEKGEVSHCQYVICSSSACY